jgi:hypothetical protein
MSRIAAVALTIGLGIFVHPLTAQSCSTASIKGSYGFVSSIRIAPASASSSSRRVRFIGVITYDGQGNATASGLSVTSGNQEKLISVTGPYQVDPHCVGRVALKDHDNSVAVWRFVIVNGASELLTISERSSDTAPFVQKKQ